MKHRGREIKVGGKLVLDEICMAERSKFAALEVMNDALIKMKQKGRITDEEGRKFTIPECFRTKEEFIAGIDTDLWQIDTIEFIGDIKNPLYEDYNKHHGTNICLLVFPDELDAKRFGDAMASWLKAWADKVFESAISSKSTQEVQAIKDEFFATIADIISNDPERFKDNQPRTVIVLTKISSCF